MNYTAQQLFALLNTQDECPWIEAKGGREGSTNVINKALITEAGTLTTEVISFNTEAKDDNYLSREFIKPMIESGKLNYKYPEMRNHPHQAYLKN